MDPHGDKLPGLNLPPLSSGGVPTLAAPTDNVPPIDATAPPVHPSVSAAPMLPPSQPVPVPPVAADDRPDDLDEEWVSKAKTIVEKTKADPYIESSELSKVKADYLNVRYNKHIKIAEDRPQ